MIKIIDNFFEEKDLREIQHFALNNAYYTPCFFEHTTEKNQKNHYGNRWYFPEKSKFLNLFLTQAENKFKIKIKKIHPTSGIDQRNLNHFKPHTDDPCAKVNVLIMISGPTAVTNGTVFYHGKLNQCELDIHVGFRENRAIMFPSTWVHSQHKSNVSNLKRYTSTLFIKDYEE